MSETASYEIDIQDEVGVTQFPTERVVAAIVDVLTTHATPLGSGLALVIESDETVRELNMQYRGVDAPTDVLSFPADPLPPEIAEEEAPYLGDLIVGYAYTQRHAAEAQHALDDELVLLAIHGTLHLLGYDHDTADNQAKMWAVQQTALTKAGVAIQVELFTFGDEADD